MIIGISSEDRLHAFLLLLFFRSTEALKTLLARLLISPHSHIMHFIPQSSGTKKKKYRSQIVIFITC